MYLVDTNVISEGAPGRALYSPELNDWIGRNSKQLYVSTVTIAELEAGIAKLLRSGQVARMTRLREWLAFILHLYAWHILALDLPVARVLGAFLDRARGSGRGGGFADLAIAATANVHGLTILTRNTRYFEHLDVRVLDPFRSLPPENPHAS